MFNVLLESNRRHALAGGSLVLSTVVHAVIIAGIVVARSSPSLDPVPESFITRALYLPPVDKRATGAGSTERLQFVTLGIPAGDFPALSDLPIGRSVLGQPAEDPDAGDVNGDASFSSVAAAPTIGTDTAYSVLDVDSTVQRYADSDAPLYPPTLLTQAIEGSVYVRYVVDTLGRADVTTAVVLASDHPSFTQAVLEALPGMRFRPATLSSRRVRQLVEQEFTFRITPPSMASSHGTP